MSGTGKRTLPKGTFKKSTSPKNWLQAAQKKRISEKIAANVRAKQIANFRKIQAVLDERIKKRGPGARGSSATGGPVRALPIAGLPTGHTAAGAGAGPAPAPAGGGTRRRGRGQRRMTRKVVKN